MAKDKKVEDEGRRCTGHRGDVVKMQTPPEVTQAVEKEVDKINNTVLATADTKNGAFLRQDHVDRLRYPYRVA